MVALFCVAPSPSFQTIGKASSAVLARHQVSATTATVRSLTRTTARTPRIEVTLAASKLTICPPHTGQALMAAHNCPGTRTSMAKILLPSSLSAVSRRFTPLPATFQVFGSLSVMVLASGGVSLAAAPASLP